MYMHTCIHEYMHTYIHSYKPAESFSPPSLPYRPTQTIIYVPLLVNRLQKIVVLIVQYKFFKSCSRDFILQNLILRTRSCATGFSTQSSWVFHFHPTIMVGWKCFVPQLYQFRRDISGGPALKYFNMIHWCRRWAVRTAPAQKQSAASVGAGGVKADRALVLIAELGAEIRNK